MSADPDEYLKEENAQRWQERYEFFAELVLTVLQKVSEPTPWKDIAVHAVYEYRSNRDRYIDLDMGGILTRGTRGDWWVDKKYISSANGRKRIRIVLEENGYYIATVVGKGIFLTEDSKEIKADYSRSVSGVKSRSKSLTRTAIKMNKKGRADLPIIVSQTMLEPPKSSGDGL